MLCCVLFIALSVVIIVVTALFAVFDMIAFEPILRQFVICVAILCTVMYLQWVIELPVVIQTLLGYELDKTMTLHQSETSFIKVLIPRTAVSDETVEMSKLPASPSYNPQNNMATSFARFKKTKNASELEGEIRRIREVILKSQIDLGLLENMLFVLNEAGSSADGSSSKNSFGRSYRCGNDSSRKDSEGQLVVDPERSGRYLPAPPPEPVEDNAGDAVENI